MKLKTDAHQPGGVRGRSMSRAVFYLLIPLLTFTYNLKSFNL